MTREEALLLIFDFEHGRFVRSMSFSGKTEWLDRNLGYSKNPLFSLTKLKQARVIVEGEDANPSQQSSNASKTDQRIQCIVELARKWGLDPTALPCGAKKKLKEECLKDRKLFTDSTFDHAWKAAEGRLRMERHDIYARKTK